MQGTGRDGVLSVTAQLCLYSVFARVDGAQVIDVLKSRLPSFFDEVLYMDRTTGENGASYVVFQTTEPAGLAKDRSGKLAPIEEPNILKIKNKIISK